MGRDYSKEKWEKWRSSLEKHHKKGLSWEKAGKQADKDNKMFSKSPYQIRKKKLEKSQNIFGFGHVPKTRWF